METDNDNINKDTTDKGQSLSGMGSAKVTGGQESSETNLSDDDILTSNNLAAKAEKIVAATFMVTSFLSDMDMLKTNIRGSGIKLISSLHSSAAVPAGERVVRYEIMMGLIGEIISFLFVSYSVNLVSEMNYQILKREYEQLAKNIGNLIGQIRKGEERKKVLPAAFFMTDHMSGLAASGGGIDATREGYKGQNILKDNINNMSFRPKIPKTASATNAGTKKNVIIPSIKNDRRENILRIIRKKKTDVTIKDISLLVSNCSEKTIQRELLALVSEGVLKKEGEKRWSRYSLN